MEGLRVGVGVGGVNGKPESQKASRSQRQGKQVQGMGMDDGMDLSGPAGSEGLRMACC